MAKKNKKQETKSVVNSPSHNDKTTEEEPHGDEAPTTPSSVAITETETENQISTKPKRFEKLFNDEDEIRVLQGIIKFKSEFNTLPFANEEKLSIYEVVKNSISFEATSEQFMEKIKSLKKKFMLQVGKKGLKLGHDQERFDLSMKIWGPDVESTALKSRKRKVKEEDGQGWFQKSYLVGYIADLGLGEKTVRETWSFVPKKKKQKVEEKWKALELEGLRNVLRKRELVAEVTSAIAEAMNL